MIHARIDLTDGSAKITGHSRHAEKGKDIVCAAVSAVSQVILLAALNVQDGTGTASADIEDGNMAVQADDMAYKWTLEVCAEVLKQIAEEYPEEVRVLVVRGRVRPAQARRAEMGTP